MNNSPKVIFESSEVRVVRTEVVRTGAEGHVEYIIEVPTTKDAMGVHGWVQRSPTNPTGHRLLQRLARALDET